MSRAEMTKFDFAALCLLPFANLALWVAILFMWSCGPASTPTGPATAKPTSTAMLAASSASLPLDSASWYQEHLRYPGVSGQTTHPTVPSCPANTLCEAVANSSTGEFPTYLLYLQPEWFSTVPGDPTKYHPSLSAYKSVSLSVVVISPAGTRWMWDSEPSNKGTTPAHVRAYLARALGMVDTDRWWATHTASDGSDDSACLLQAGSCTVSVPFDPAYWVDVSGIRANSSPALTAAFQAAVANPQYIGLTFGGGWYFAHGAAPTAASEIRITNFSFQK